MKFDYEIRERVSLKAHVPETRFDDQCGAEPRSTGPLANPKIKPGDPRDCWHGRCRIIQEFRDGGLLIENIYGYVRHADRDMLLKRYN